MKNYKIILEDTFSFAKISQTIPASESELLRIKSDIETGRIVLKNHKNGITFTWRVKSINEIN